MLTFDVACGVRAETEAYCRGLDSSNRVLGHIIYYYKNN